MRDLTVPPTREAMRRLTGRLLVVRATVAVSLTILSIVMPVVGALPTWGSVLLGLVAVYEWLWVAWYIREKRRLDRRSAAEKAVASEIE